MNLGIWRRSCPHSSSPDRCSKPEMDDLEPRQLLSLSSMAALPTFQLGPFAGGGPGGGYTPAQISSAYGFNTVSFHGVPGTGSGQTIAIVDAYDDPNIQADLNTFDAQFGLPATTVTRVNQSGGTSYPATDATGGWELEESLDVEWAHAMAPGANIMLVEANSTSFGDLLTAINYAASHANVVSMSWGGSEFSGESSLDSYFAQAGVAFVASAGDSGAPASYPAASPNVLSVGGTTLNLTSTNGWSSEIGWSGSGGGPSAYESQPSYQNGVVTQTSTARATPDVAYDASPYTGVAVYDSLPYEGSTLGWIEVGGTSAGAPQWSALLAIADQGRALTGQAPLNNTSPQQVMNILYANPADFHDITSGTSTGTPNYSAGPGYDYVTGMGSPITNLVVGSLVGTSTTGSYDKLVVSATPAETAGQSFNVTVTAEKPNGTVDTGYTGTIQFTSTDAQASLPSNFTFSSTNQGTYTFPVTLKTAGSQSITVTDTSTLVVTGTLSGITVNPAAASQFVISGLPSSAFAGSAQTFTITAKDPYGNVATGYTGTVQLSSSDPNAIFAPASYAFSSSDRGTHAFSVTFETAGTQSLTAQGTTTGATAGITATQSGIMVAPAAPTNLVAQAASSSEIDLTWTGSAGATSYLIQQSLSSTTGWTQVGSTTGATSFKDTGLTSGTTYYFRVIAMLGTMTSSASNVASAQTTGTAPALDSIWTSSYVPSINAYAFGSYELGVKFTSSQVGEVTGVRFYKQPWMFGQSNVGHLWSSTGKLLATAVFTKETSSGWQQVTFASPVAITPNTVYIASYSTSWSYFGITTGFFNSQGVSNGPLQALSNSVPGGNGVYNLAGAFPSYNGNGMNFWTDVAFTPSSTSETPATLISQHSATALSSAIASTPSTSNSTSHVTTTPPATTPAGPVRHTGRSSRTGSRAATAAYSSHTVPQAASHSSWQKKPSFASDRVRGR
ncbi:MAG: DUF4082 domain-containing protein [Isosphaeraceae bacterium]